MAKTILTFLILWGFIGFGISCIRHMSGKEVWSLTKLAVYSMMCAVLALVFLSGFVIIF